MRILTFLGDYGYNKSEFFSGFICFCHIEKEETEDKIKKIALKLISVSNNLKIILVPFAHLYEDAAESPIAQRLFNQLADEIKVNGCEVILAPFGVAKELHLDIPADNSAVKFFNF